MHRCRGISNAAWWIFVVSAIFAQLARSRLMCPIPMIEYSGEYHPLPKADGTEVVYETSLSISTPGISVDVISVLAYLAPVITLVLAAIGPTGWPNRLGVTAATVVAAAMILFCPLACVFGWELPIIAEFLLVLCGVALRAGWIRWATREFGQKYRRALDSSR